MFPGTVAPLAHSEDPKATPSFSGSSGKRTAIFIQDECVKHRFIRSRDISGIVERPERLRAVKLGLAAAIARIEEVESSTSAQKPGFAPLAATGTDDGDLAVALARMAIAPITAGPSCPTPSSPPRTGSVAIRRTSASASLLDHAAVKYIHGDIERDVYLENLIAWARDSQKNITRNGTEIPEGVPPLDLYLCPGSIDAIQGAIGAVCEAVDAISTTRGPGPQSFPIGPGDPCERAFVAIRPPGHHCGENTPSGFCFINNVAVGAAHAHLNHGMQRVAIFDIDLHHGNGTQSIAWQINEETYRQTLEIPKTDTPPAKQGLRVFYGSMHDILSFPCEDGEPEKVQAASTSIHGPHGQYIENVHLQRYESEAQFWSVIYPRYLLLLHRARDFLDETGGPGDDVMMFISCGFDAGEHEYPSMSRHQRKVPVGFYHQFTREICRLADVYAGGRVVSVLEGGYSDRALISGAMAHLCGLVDVHCTTPLADPDDWVDRTWWNEDNLIKLEKSTKPRRTASTRARVEEWLARTVGLLTVLGDGGDTGKVSSSHGTSVSSDSSTWITPTSMTLRERKKPMLDGARGPLDSVRTGKNIGRSVSTPQTISSTSAPRAPSASVSAPEIGRKEANTSLSDESDPRKKLPRVILHVRPPDGTR